LTHFLEWTSGRLEYPGLWVVSLAYLTLDFYPEVPSLAAIWRTSSFWMLWAVFSFLDTIAFSGLYGKSYASVQSVITAPLVATAAIQLLSTIGVYSILQSLTLQFAGKKVIDVEELLSRFRSRALQDATAKKANLEKRRAGNMADTLRAIYKDDLQALSEDYSQVMSVVNMPRARIVSTVDQYKSSQGSDRDALLSELAMRMAVADPESVRGILRRRRPI